MAVPSRRRSPSRQGKRRGSNMKIDHADLSACPQCRRPKLPHRVCIHCGFYKGREIVKMS